MFVLLAREIAAMENTKKPCLLLFLVLLLLVSTVHAVQLEDAKDIGTKGKRIAVDRWSFTGRKAGPGHGRGYSRRGTLRMLQAPVTSTSTMQQAEPSATRP